MQCHFKCLSRAGRAFHSAPRAHAWGALLLLVGVVCFMPRQALADEAADKLHEISGGEIKQATIFKGTFTPKDGKPPKDVAGKQLKSGRVERAVITQGELMGTVTSGVSVTHARLSNARIVDATISASGVSGTGTLSDAELTDATVELKGANFSGYALVPSANPCDDMTYVDLTPENLDPGSVPRLRTIIDSCTRRLPSMTRVEISRARADMKHLLDGVKSSHEKTGLSGDQYLRLYHAERELNHGLKAFEKLAGGWQDTFESYFYFGYSGTTVDNVRNKGTPLFGLYIYNEFDNVLKECPPERSEPGTCGWTPVVPHVYGNIFQAGSAESGNVATPPAGGGAAQQVQVVPAIEVNIGVFWPLYTHRQQAFGNLPATLAIGPIAEHGWKMNSNQTTTVGRIYEGVRMAFSQNVYFDIMLGRTTGRKGRRVELRGQMPVYEFPIGQVYLGGVLNYDWKGAEPNTDTNQIYVIYRASFEQVFGKKEDSGKKE